MTGNGRTLQGVRCRQVFTGAAQYTGILITLIAFLPDVGIAKGTMALDRPSAGPGKDSLADLHGAGAEAFQYISLERTGEKELDVVVRRSNAKITVTLDVRSTSLTAAVVASLFTSMGGYADKELAALKVSAARS